MGMFDSLIDRHGDEWQTKAFDCLLRRFSIGDAIGERPPVPAYQVAVLGDPTPSQFVDSFATIRDGVLVDVPADRDPSLPLMNYSGHWVDDA